MPGRLGRRGDRLSGPSWRGTGTGVGKAVFVCRHMCLVPRTALSRQVWCRERHIAVVERPECAVRSTARDAKVPFTAPQRTL